MTACRKPTRNEYYARNDSKIKSEGGSVWRSPPITDCYTMVMQLKILSLNIEHGGVTMQPLLEFIRDTNADIMLLQEVHSSGDQSLEPRLRTMQYFAEELDYTFSSFAPKYRDFDNTEDGTSYSGNAVFSRLPILETRTHYHRLPYSETYHDSFETAAECPDVLQQCLIRSSAGDINVFNLHGPWDLDGEHYGEGRQKMSDAIIAATTGLPRVILGGDTNAKPVNEAFTRITHLKSVFGDELQTTFNMKRKKLPGYATAAVDMIWLSPDIHLVTKARPDVDVSDHLPLIVSVAI